MVLFCLMLLVLALTVMVTLGIASRVHDRMEAQVAADAAAYSEAVLTARTFNAIALINRAQVGQMVAMAAVQSLISWTGAGYGNFVQLQTVDIPTAQAGGMCTAELTALQTALAAAQATADANFQKLDEAAGDQVRSLQGSASGLRKVQLNLLASLVSELAQSATGAVPNICPACTTHQGPLLPGVSPKNMVAKLAKGANPQLDTPPKNGDWKSVMEVESAVTLTDSSPTSDSVYATMGSIGDPFVNSRSAGSLGFSTGVKFPGFTGGSSGGGAGFGQNWPGAQKLSGAGSYAAWAHDDAGSFKFTLTCPGGSVPIVSTATAGYVYSSEEQLTDDAHVYSGSDNKPAEKRHTLGACVVCHGIWPFFLDYALSSSGSADPLGRAINDHDNLYGQPVLYAVVQRDYSKIKDDPWNLRFDFHFTSEGAEFDNGGRRAGSKVKKGESNAAFSPYTYQVALSAGLAYYHRHDHAKEPPNFFNPFWRATLIPPEIDSSNDVDLGNGGDAVRALKQAGHAQHAAALVELEKHGYAVTELSP